MTQPSMIFSLPVFVAAALLLPARAAAQNNVTPIVKPTPAGTLITVNSTAGANHTDPHVDGDLVCYTNEASATLQSVRYFNLVTGTDNAVPTAFNGSADFLCDVHRTTIGFTREGAQADILTFDTASSTLTEIDPTPGSQRFGGQISDQTIAWWDFGTSSTVASIVAWDRVGNIATVISGFASVVNNTPGISPDGSVVVWEDCTTSSSCVIWKATRSGPGAWNPQQLLSQFSGGSHPDTDGAIIAYSSASPCAACTGTSSDKGQVAWQSVASGNEQTLNLPGSAIDPSVSAGLIAFAYDATDSGVHQIALYDTHSNFLYNLSTDANFGDVDIKSLNDISVTPDGKVRVVWQELDANASQWNVYAYVFNLPVGDFSFSPISPLTIAAGGSGSASITVSPLNGFSSAVNLSVTGQPAGVTALPSPNQVTPSGGNSATSILSVNLPDFMTPINFTLTVTGTSGALTHSATANVTVTATTTSVGNLIGDLLNAGCIDNAGIGNALTSKLSAAQSAAAAGNIQTAINTLTALKNQINAQAGKHIATACTLAGVAFNPVTALLLDVQGLIDSLRVGLIADPITGYVVNSRGVGVPGATVSVFDANGNIVAAATTDITGFYYMATTGVLSPGANYTLQTSSLPAGFASATPPNQPFTWQGTAVAFADFVLN